jgi:hypothetical protein
MWWPRATERDGFDASARVEVMTERSADHFRHGDVLLFRSLHETALEFRIESHGLNGREICAEAWTTAFVSSSNDGGDIEAALSLVRELFNELVVDHFAGLGMPVGSLGHRSKNLRFTARSGIA